MLNKIFKKWAINGKRREVEKYLYQVSLGDIEDHWTILAHGALIMSQFIKKIPVAMQVIKMIEDEYAWEAAILVLKTNTLLNDYSSAHDIENSAGIKLWNETFRCLSSPELKDIGINLWKYFTKSQNEAKKYLIRLERNYVIQGNDDMVIKINEAMNYITLIPTQYKE